MEAAEDWVAEEEMGEAARVAVDLAVVDWVGVGLAVAGSEVVGLVEGSGEVGAAAAEGLVAAGLAVVEGSAAEALDMSPASASHSPTQSAASPSVASTTARMHKRAPSAHHRSQPVLASPHPAHPRH